MRWLETQGKHDKVINTLKNIANTNKKPMPDLSPNTTQIKVILQIDLYNMAFCY